MRVITLLVVTVSLLVGGCEQQSVFWIDQVKESLAKREYRSAVIELKNHLRDEPSSQQARLLLGQTYLKMEDGAAAQKELLIARALEVTDETILPLLGQALLLQRDFDKVLQLKTAVVLSPLAQGEFEASRAIALAETRQLAEARQTIERAVSAAPASFWVRFSRARVLLAEGDQASAKQRLEELTADDPEIGMAWSVLGTLYEAEGELKSAEAAYSKAIEHRFYSFPDQLRRGIVRVSTGDLDGALTDAQAVKRKSPNHHLTHYLMGLVAYRHEEYPQAEESLEAVLSTDDRHVPTIYVLALTKQRLDKKDAAFDLARRAVSLDPTHIPARKLLASMYLERDDAQSAEETLMAAVRGNPEDLELKQLLARSLAEQGKLAQADELLSELTEKQRDSPEAQLQYGFGMLRARDRDAGLEAIRRGIELAPTDGRLRTAVIGGLLNAKEVDVALAMAEQFLESDRNNPSSWNNLAIARLAKGEQELAVSAFGKALELQPGLPGASENLALLAAQREDFQAARRYLEAGLSHNPKSVRLLYRLAELERRDNNPVRSKELLQQALVTNPSSLRARLALARQHLNESDPAQALYLLSAVEKRSDSVDFLRAEAYVQQARYQDAKSLLESLRAKAPQSPEIHFLIARVYAELGDTDALKDSVDRVAELMPDSNAAKVLKARIHIIENRLEDAARILDEMEASDVPISTAYLGTRLRLERSRGDVEAEIAAALSMFDHHPSTLTATGLADTLIRAGKINQAIGVLEQWLIDHAEDPRATTMLAEIYLHSGRIPEAISLYEALHQRNPKNILVLNNLAWFSRDADPEQALGYAEKAYALAPQSPEVLDTYAELLARSGRGERSLRMIDRAIENSKDNPAYKLRRAELLELLGNRQQAVRELQGLVSADTPEMIKQRASKLLGSWSN